MQENQNESPISKSTLSDGGDLVPTKRVTESILPYYTVPSEIIKWILSFVVSPEDFVRLRTVSKQWNRLLGELFFGTAMVNRLGLLRLIKILQSCFEDRIPFILKKNLLTVSAHTKYTDYVLVDCPVDTTGIEGGNAHYFLMPTNSFSKILESDSRDQIPLCFQDSIGKITYRAKDGSIVTTISKDGYDAEIHIGERDPNRFPPFVVPEYNLEVETDAGMVQTVIEQMNSSVHISLRMYQSHHYINDILILSWRPDDMYDFGVDSNHSVLRTQSVAIFNFFFKKKEQHGDEKTTRWKPADYFDLYTEERICGPENNTGNEYVLVYTSLRKKAIRDSLRMLDRTHPISMCISTEDCESPLIIKYSIEWSRDRMLNIQWFVQ
jgi:hypothetical protein